LSNRYQPVIHAWSYKTNYLNAVCATLHQEGSWAEVVSVFEYDKARALGVPSEKILVNGPHKNRGFLTRCIQEGARVHIDNLDELTLLASLAETLNIRTSVTLRINFDTPYTEDWSRFGFNLSSGAAFAAAMQIADSSHLHLRGLHSHIDTFVLEPKAYQVQIEKMCEFMNLIEQHRHIVIDSFDLGGGFASQNLTQQTVLMAQKTPSFDDYAQVICTAMTNIAAQRQAAGKPHLTLILESGRAVIDDAEMLLSSIVARKRLPDGRASYSMDAGVNLLFTAFLYQHAVKPTRALSGTTEETVLYGSLCMNTDVLRHSVQLPALAVGDSLVFCPVGAYNNTQWLQFIEYRPNVVMIAENGQVSVVRRAETLADINGFENLPPHLQNGFNFA
jgi:diaminopimelate decarboxylase